MKGFKHFSEDKNDFADLKVILMGWLLTIEKSVVCLPYFKDLKQVFRQK